MYILYMNGWTAWRSQCRLYRMREKEEINWTDVAWNKDNKKVNYETNKMSSLYFKYNNGQIDIGNYCHFQQRSFPVIDNIAFWLTLVLEIDWSCDLPIYIIIYWNCVLSTYENVKFNDFSKLKAIPQKLLSVITK